MSEEESKGKMDRDRLDKVELKTDRLETAMVKLTENVNDGFKGIAIELTNNNKSIKDEIGKLYGHLNTHALKDAQKGQISWPLIISVIAVIFVAANFFKASITDHVDRTITSERELRQVQDEANLYKAELLMYKKHNTP